VVIANNFLCLFYNYLHESEKDIIEDTDAELMKNLTGARVKRIDKGPGSLVSRGAHRSQP
jgi:hypothetical protein